MQEFFNDYVQSLETYIMFRIKETVARITPELIQKGRAPISLSMGAPTANPPQALIDALKNALDEKGVHLYSTPKGEPYFREAIARRMKNRFNVYVPQRKTGSMSTSLSEKPVQCLRPSVKAKAKSCRENDYIYGRKRFSFRAFCDGLHDTQCRKYQNSSHIRICFT